MYVILNDEIVLIDVGLTVGNGVGDAVGPGVGAVVGAVVGMLVGIAVGVDVGSGVGAGVKLLAVVTSQGPPSAVHILARSNMLVSVPQAGTSLWSQ